MRSSPSITAAMIVRNEETHLESCLASIVGQVDQIVVVDTGSTDKTLEIAWKYGALIIQRPWSEDFAVARNCALDHANSDWILYIDADERLSLPRPDGLRDVVKQDDAVACWVLFQPRVGFTRYHELRLFRRDPRIRFCGAIHESVHPSIDAVCRSDALNIVEANVCVDHFGYEGDLRHKYRRNLPILERAVKEAPERVFLWADMAKALAGLGQREEAEQACWRAINVAADNSDRKQRNDGALAWECLISLHLDTNVQRAADLAKQATGSYPENHALALARANALFLGGCGDEILPVLKRLTSIDAETFLDPLTAYDHRIFREWPFDLMGGVYARVGQRAAAAEAFRQAARFAPENLAYRAKAVAFSRSVSD
jgi:tetratricopeptide (TPR) repeat protein